MLSSKHALIPSSVIGFLLDDTNVVLAMPASSFWKKARLGLSKCFTSSFRRFGAISFYPLFSYSVYSMAVCFITILFTPLQARRHFPFCSLPLQFNSNHLSSLLIHCFFARNDEIFQLYAAVVIFASVPVPLFLLIGYSLSSRRA